MRPYIACEEQPEQALREGLAAWLGSREHLLQLRNAVPPEADTLLWI